MSIVYKKLDWIQDTPTINVTQGFHGQYQNGTAMDFTAEPLVAPCDLELVSDNGSGQQQWFEVKLLNTNGTVIIQCVHGRPAKLGSFKKGEVFGYCNWHHWHLAIRVNNQWQGLMTYIDKNKAIKLIGSPWGNPYDQWSFYNDRSIAFISDNETPNNPAPDNNNSFTPPEIPEIEQPGTEGPAIEIDMCKENLIEADKQNRLLSNRVIELQRQLKESKGNNGVIEKVIETGQKEGWDWLKVWKSLMRDSYIQTILGSGITIGVGFLVIQIPELASLQELIVTSLLGILGITATGKQIEKFKK